jgi:transcriptional regulator with XRE-family HTH domain
MHETIKAVRELRRRLGDSQQAFATRLGISIRAVGNYENSRVPKSARALSSLVRAAKAGGQPELAEVFGRALAVELGKGSWEFVDLAENKLALARVGSLGDLMSSLPLAQRGLVDKLDAELLEISRLLESANPFNSKEDSE